jgi:hypothetical protein
MTFTPNLLDNPITPEPAAKKRRGRFTIIAGSVCVAGLALGLLGSALSSHSAPSQPAQAVSAPAVQSPDQSFLANVRAGSTDVTDASDALLTTIGHAAVSDIEQGDNAYGLLSDAEASASTLSDAGFSLTTNDVMFIAGAGVKAYAPQYIPLVAEWANGDYTATANSLSYS